MKHTHALLLLLMLTMLCGFVTAPAGMMIHPFHVTLAQAEVAIDEQGHQVLQIALRVDPMELEKALTQRADRRINIEKTEKVDELIVAYLDEVFLVRHPAKNKNSKPTPLDPCPPPPPVTQADEKDKPTTRPDQDEEKQSILRWVGKEIDLRYAWLYFEICIPEGSGGVEGLEFSNRIFFKAEPTQANTINFVDGKKIASLSFTHQEVWATLRFKKAH